MSSERPYLRPAYQALGSCIAIGLFSAFVYTALWYLDFGHQPGAPSPLELIQMVSAGDTVAGLAEVIVAVLGIAITVVAIIVELAANRYTPRISELFIRDPVNAAVLCFFSVTAVLVLATAMSIGSPQYPRIMVTCVVIAMMISLTALLPYFLYVFDFLTPTSIITRIQYTAIRSIRTASKQRNSAVLPARHAVKDSIEQLGDISLNSLEKKEKAIALAALDGLADLTIASLYAKELLPKPWFQTEELATGDRDFVSLHPAMTRVIETRQTWLEMKVLRQFQSVFGESVNRIRDCGHMVAIHTRNIATHAVQLQQPHTLDLTVRFMNTYLRAAINKKDVRSAYNLFNEYRSLAESTMMAGQYEHTIQAAERFKFYGQLAFHGALPFILETAAYDLCTLIEKSHEMESPSHLPMLEIFLDVDREPEGEKGQEDSLRGVRKAQIKLATYYLVKGEESYARRIFEDMRSEPPHRLLSIRKELESIVAPEYWEVSDRGINFDYLDVERRSQLTTFFSWFQQL